MNLCRASLYFKLHTVNLHLGIKEQISLNLEPYETAKLILHLSSGTPNTGEIVVEVAEPNETLARNYAKEILQRLSFFLSIEENTTVGRIKIKNVVLENPEELEGVIKKNVTSRGLVRVVAGSLNQGEITNLGDKFRKIHALTKQEKELLLRFLRVYNSGRKGQYPSDDLIYRWTALEVIVSDLSKRQKTWNSINDFISRRFPVDRAKDIVQKHDQTINELINANVQDFDRNNNYSELLKEELQQSKPHWKEVLKYALRCIYEVRNGVIHRSEDYKFISLVNRMLDYILKEFWDFRSPN